MWGWGFNQSGNENGTAGVADETPSIRRLDGQKRPAGSLTPRQDRLTHTKLDVLQVVPPYKRREKSVNKLRTEARLPTSHPKEPSLTP